MLVKIKKSPYYYSVLYMYGRQVWVSTKCAGKKKAAAVDQEIKKRYQEKRRAEKIAGLIGDRARIKNGLPISAAWKKYCEIKPDWGDHTWNHWRIFESWLLKNKPQLSDLLEIDRYVAYQFLSNEYKDAAAKTQNNVKSSLCNVWKNLAVAADLDNPWLHIPNKQGDSIRYRAFSLNEVKAIFKAAKGLWHDLAVLGLYTGLRKKDIIFLKWDQIKAGFLELIPAKTSRFKKAVRIPLHDAVKKVLERNKNDDQYVFPVAVARYTSGAFAEEFPAILKAAGIEDNDQGRASFHGLRSTFITRCESLGVPRSVVQGLVGHRSPAMTAHYSEDYESAKQILKITY